MNILFFLIILIKLNFNEAVVRDLSGLYSFENCACTTLRCLPQYVYQLNQNRNGEFTMSVLSSIPAARGTTTSINNGLETQLSIQWLPGMDFDTNCTGLWIPTKRAIEMKCGDQYRYCTGQFQCRQNSGPCSSNNSAPVNIQHISALWNIILSATFLLLIEKLH